MKGTFLKNGAAYGLAYFAGDQGEIKDKDLAKKLIQLGVFQAQKRESKTASKRKKAIAPQARKETR